MRDLTKLGFADDLALVAGLEEVGRTCCLAVIIGHGDTDNSLTLSTIKI